MIFSHIFHVQLVETQYQSYTWGASCLLTKFARDCLQEEHPQIVFVKADTTNPELESLTSEQGVKVLPTFKFFKGGNEAKSPVSGYKKKLLEDAVKSLSK